MIKSNHFLIIFNEGIRFKNCKIIIIEFRVIGFPIHSIDILADANKIFLKIPESISNSKIGSKSLLIM